VVHFEMQLGLEQAIGDVEGAADARFSIALARSKYEGSNAKNNEELLKVSHDVYTLYAAELGEVDAATSKSNQYHIAITRARAHPHLMLLHTLLFLL